MIAAGKRRSPDSAEAMRWLCEQYWFPIYAYARQRGKDPHEAQDLAQGFFAEMLTDNAIAAADENQGSFRKFLVMRFSFFMGDVWKKDNCIKRGRGAKFFTLEEAEERFLTQLIDPRSAEHAYDRAWILAVIERVMLVLQVECDADGKTGRFKVLKKFLEVERNDATYAEVAAKIRITVPALRMITYRLRQRFREMITQEVRQIVLTENEVRPELSHLLKALE